MKTEAHSSEEKKNQQIDKLLFRLIKKKEPENLWQVQNTRVC